jgi:hypothetical protein
MHDFDVASNCVMSILNFIKIRPAVLEFKQTDKRDQLRVHSFCAHCAVANLVSHRLRMGAEFVIIFPF